MPNGALNTSVIIFLYYLITLYFDCSNKLASLIIIIIIASLKEKVKKSFISFNYVNYEKLRPE